MTLYGDVTGLRDDALRRKPTLRREEKRCTGSNDPVVIAAASRAFPLAVHEEPAVSGFLFAYETTVSGLGAVLGRLLA